MSTLPALPTIPARPVESTPSRVRGMRKRTVVEGPLDELARLQDELAQHEAAASTIRLRVRTLIGQIEATAADAKAALTAVGW